MEPSVKVIRIKQPKWLMEDPRTLKKNYIFIKT
jgi:hypothetical protein